MDDTQPDVEAIEEVPAAQEELAKRFPWTVVLVTVLVVLILYPLSLGPVLWLEAHGFLNDRPNATVEAVYGPLLEQIDYPNWPPQSTVSGAIVEPYRSYLGLWVGPNYIFVRREAGDPFKILFVPR